MSIDRILCQSCGQPKLSLEKKKSALTGSDLLMCMTCIKKGFEPRYLIMIAYNSGGRNKQKAERLIKLDAYVGDRILLKEAL